MLINTTIEEVGGYDYDYGQKIPTGAAAINTERFITYETASSGTKTKILYNLRGDDRRENSVELLISTAFATVTTAMTATTETILAVTYYSGNDDTFTGDTATSTRFVRDFVIAYAPDATNTYQTWGEGAFKNKELRVAQTLAALITAVTP